MEKLWLSEVYGKTRDFKGMERKRQVRGETDR